MPGSPTTPGRQALAIARLPCCLPRRQRRRPEFCIFRGSMAGLRIPCQRFASSLAEAAHDSGPVWFATPSS